MDGIRHFHFTVEQKHELLDIFAHLEIDAEKFDLTPHGGKVPGSIEAFSVKSSTDGKVYLFIIRVTRDSGYHCEAHPDIPRPALREASEWPGVKAIFADWLRAVRKEVRERGV